MNLSELHDSLSVYHSRLSKHKKGSKYYDALYREVVNLYKKLKIENDYSERLSMHDAMKEALRGNKAAERIGVNANTLKSLRKRLKDGRLSEKKIQEVLKKAGYKCVIPSGWVPEQL